MDHCGYIVYYTFQGAKIEVEAIAVVGNIQDVN